MGVRLDDAMIAMIAMLTCCHVFLHEFVHGVMIII